LIYSNPCLFSGTVLLLTKEIFCMILYDIKKYMIVWYPLLMTGLSLMAVIPGLTRNPATLRETSLDTPKAFGV
jgi:hypothetical protein